MNRREFVGSMLATISLTELLVARSAGGEASPLWDFARQMRSIHRFSTWFYVHNVRDLLSTDAGMASALEWCRQTAVTRVYVESFRDGYQVDSALLKKVKKQLEEAGLEVAGGITPTEFGKRSTGWSGATCYTSELSQERLQAMVTHCVSVFDELLVDDFFFTDCKCPECDAAHSNKRVRVGDRDFAVQGNSWPEYRSELMLHVLRHRMIGPAKAANPRAKVMLKYPAWKERLYLLGYDVMRQLAEIDGVWQGTELRDLDKRGELPYHAYFIMRWMSGLAGAKCGGGWYDWLDTTEQTFVQQARQTVLAGAAESVLCCYGGLIYDKVSMPCCFDGVKQKNGPADVLAFRRNVRELFDIVREVRSRRPVGIAAYFNPAGSHHGDQGIFECVGTLGFPLAPCHEFPTRAPAACFSMHLLAEPDWAEKLRAFVESGRPVVLSRRLSEVAGQKMDFSRSNVVVLPEGLNATSVWQITQDRADTLRQPLLNPLRLTLRCPAGVGLYPFEDGSWVLENFSSRAAVVALNERRIEVPPRGWTYEWARRPKGS